MLPESVAYLCFVVSFIGGYFLLKSIIYGNTRLNLVSWFLWGTIPLIGVFLQLRAGAGTSVIPVLLAGIFPLIYFFVSLSRGNSYWKISRLDIVCGIFSVCAVVLWIITQNTGLALFFVVLADGLAAVPTIVKTWKFPETESVSGYLPGVINNIIGLLVITNWSFSIYSFSLYIIILNTSIIFFILRKKLFS